MMTKFRLLIAALLLAGSASALAVNTWDLTSGGSYAGNAYLVGGLSVTGWADTNAANPRTVQQQSATANNSTGLTLWTGGGGLGMVNADSCGSGTSCAPGTGTSSTSTAGDTYEANTGEHAIDNNQRSEMVLVNFGVAKVSLTKAVIGWNGTDNQDSNNAYQDSDMTILAYIGSGNAATALAGLSWSSVGAKTNTSGINNAANNAGKDWILIGNYNNVGASNGTAAGGSADVTTQVYSSDWLIGANNPLGTANATTDTTSGITYDSFKLSALSACTQGTAGCASADPNNQVAEPSAIALFGLALMGAAAVRRRKAA